jgi:hypothetical protein
MVMLRGQRVTKHYAGHSLSSTSGDRRLVAQARCYELEQRGERVQQRCHARQGGGCHRYPGPDVSGMPTVQDGISPFCGIWVPRARTPASAES